MQIAHILLGENRHHMLGAERRLVDLERLVDGLEAPVLGGLGGLGRVGNEELDMAVRRQIEQREMRIFRAVNLDLDQIADSIALIAAEQLGRQWR